MPHQSRLEKLFATSPRRRRPLTRAPRARKAVVEFLEDRLVLSYTVTNTSGTLSMPGSLGYEIGLAVAANAQAATIDFNPMDVPANSTIELASNEVNSAAAEYGPTAYFINGTSGTNITIDGSAVPGLRIDGGNAVRLFTVTSGDSLTLKNLTLQDGYAFGGAGFGGGGGGAGLGGAVFDNGGSFAADGCTFVDNQAVGGKGAAPSGAGREGGGGGGLGASAPGNGDGGGVHGGGGPGGDGDFGGFGGGGGFGGSGGFGGGGGGGSGAAASGGFGGGGGGSSSFGAGGSAGGFGGGNGIGSGGGGAGMGGGIFCNQGAITLSNDTFNANSARGGTSGGVGGDGGDGLGGAVFARNGSVNATNVTFSSNTAAQGGTDVFILSDKSNGGNNTSPGSGSATAKLINCILGQNASTTATDFVASSNDGGAAPTFTGSTNNLVTLNGAGSNGLPAGALVAGTIPHFANAGLTNNGGDTPTIALTAQSTAALETGATGTGVTVDQRGVTRSTPPDLGAYQFSPALVSIAVTPASPTVPDGETQQFMATGTYSNDSTENLTSDVTWASATTSVATITAGGAATAKAASGTSTISATLGTITGSTVLTASAAVLESIAVTPLTPTVPKGETQQFTATGTYSGGSTGNLTSTVTWASATTSVATITTGGLATAVAATGTSTISATLGTITGSTVLTASAAVLESIAVTPLNPTVPKGETQQFTATGTYSGGSTENLTSTVTWASATTSVATITTGGLATAVAATGTSTISATLGTITGSTVLTVTAAVQSTVTSAAVSWGSDTMPLVTQADGLRLLPAGRSTDMPWLGINKITITLSAAASLAPGDVSVAGITVANYGPVTISGSGTTYTITLAQAINLADRVTVTIANAGIATFTRRLDVLPGDFNDDGAVNSADVLGVDRAIGETSDLFAEIDGDGTVTMADVQTVRSRVGTYLPPV